MSIIRGDDYGRNSLCLLMQSPAGIDWQGLGVSRGASRRQGRTWNWDCGGATDELTLSVDRECGSCLPQRPSGFAWDTISWDPIMRPLRRQISLLMQGPTLGSPLCLFALLKHKVRQSACSLRSSHPRPFWASPPLPPSLPPRPPFAAPSAPAYVCNCLTSAGGQPAPTKVFG